MHFLSVKIPDLILPMFTNMEIANQQTYDQPLQKKVQSANPVATDKKAFLACSFPG